MKPTVVFAGFLLLLFFQATASACVDQNTNACSLQASRSYLSGYGGANLYTYPAYFNHSASFEKVVVVMWGYDPGNLQTPGEILAQLNERYSLVTQLRNSGYDIVLVKPKDSNTYIQRNAYVLVDVLKHISEKSNNTDVKLLGLSLGGVTGKYALAYMADNNIAHNVNKYISFDAPHNGAHIPVGMQTIPPFLEKATNSARSRLNSITAKFVTSILNINLDDMSQELREARNKAAILTDQYVNSPVAYQLLINHYTVAQYHHYGNAARESVRVKFSRSEHSGDAYTPPPKPCTTRFSSGGDAGDETPGECRYLKNKRVSYGENFCESIYKADKLGFYGPHHGDAWGGLPQGYYCGEAIELYRGKDTLKPVVDKIASLKNQLKKEFSQMGELDVPSVAITNGNLYGYKLSVQPGQRYFGYRGEYDGAKLYLDVYAYSPASTYFSAKLTAPDPKRFGLRTATFGRMNFSGTSNLPFLDNASGGYEYFPEDFAEFFNETAGSSFGNMHAQISRHSFIPTCSALGIHASVNSCRYSSEEQAAAYSPFDRVYFVDGQRSTRHLSLSDSLSVKLFDELTAHYGDAFSNDSSETIDSDGDGVGDNADAFPNDPTETVDSNGDGIGDNTDTTPVYFGSAGGSGGRPFEDFIDKEGFRISSVSVRSGARVDAIQITYTDALGNLYPQPRRGGGGGRANVVNLNSDEYIVAISGVVPRSGRKSNRVHRLDFTTSNGRKFSFGRGKGTSFSFSGKKVLGFFGRSGRELDAIGVIAIR